MAAAVTTDTTTTAATAIDLAAILQRMRAAQRKSGAPSFEQRIRHLELLRRRILAKKTRIIEAISRDFGARSRHETLLAEIFTTVEGLSHAERNLASWMEAREHDVGWAFAPASAEVVFQPVGVVGIISPWNYPFFLALSPLTGALAAGNRVMLKPSELTPESSLVLTELLAETFDADHVCVVAGGPDVGDAFARLPLDHLVFTGSTRVGKLVMAAAAENLTPVTLELGGKSPALVGEEAGLRRAARAIAFGKLLNAGQTCLAPDYALVPEAKRDTFITEMKAAIADLYPTLAKNPDYTNIINAQHRARLEGYLTDAQDRGAAVTPVNPANEEVDGRTGKLAPTLVTSVTDEMHVMQEEIFGPILPIKTYKTMEEAIGYVNDHPRPLALYYFGHTESRIEQVISQTISGGVSINATLFHAVQDDLPFGGIGASGMGHYHGRDGFETFSKKKPVFYESRFNGSVLRTPPFGKLIDSFFRVVLGK